MTTDQEILRHLKRIVVNTNAIKLALFGVLGALVLIMIALTR